MPGPTLRWIFTLLILCGLLVPVRASAQVGLTGQPLSVCIARATPAIDGARALRDPAPFACGGQQHDLGPGDFWVRAAAVPPGVPVDQPLHVRFASVWLDSLTLYAHYADGRTVTISADDADVARAIQLGAIIDLRLPAYGARLEALAWHVRGAANLRGVIVGPRIATQADSVSSNIAMGAIYAGFAGLALALLVHNLALWQALRQPFQVYYMAMLGGLLVYAFSSSGTLAWVWPELGNTARLRLNYLTLSAAAIAALGFARHFFEPRIFAGWVGRGARAVSVAIAVTAALFAALAPWHIWWLDRAFTIAFAALIAVVIPVLWRSWSLRSDYRWLFSLAWGAPIVLAGFRVAHTLGQVNWRFWLDNSTLLAMTVEALISSLAIGYRVRQIAQERDVARAQEIAARLLADADPLTGLLNRRAFLARAIGRSGDQRLLILDIDHFKRVNDTIGHDGGDEVLRRIARLLRQHCPADGLVTRLGGEEFALLAPVQDAPDAQGLLAALRAERMPFDLHVTASIGACTGPLAGEADWKALYRAADRALFQAKDAGRDRARLSLAA